MCDIKMYFSRRKELRLIRKAKARATYLAEKNNCRFFVFKDWEGIIRIADRESVKDLKRKGILSKSVNIYHLEKEALFIADPPRVERRKTIIKS